jgi:hypothetical protein
LAAKKESTSDGDPHRSRGAKFRDAYATRVSHRAALQRASLREAKRALKAAGGPPSGQDASPSLLSEAQAAPSPAPPGSPAQGSPVGILVDTVSGNPLPVGEPAAEPAGLGLVEPHALTDRIVVNFRNNTATRLTQQVIDKSPTERIARTDRHPDWTPAHLLVQLGPAEADSVCLLRACVSVLGDPQATNRVCVLDILGSDGCEVLRAKWGWRGVIRTTTGRLVHLTPGHVGDTNASVADLVHLRRCWEAASEPCPPPLHGSLRDRVTADWYTPSDSWLEWTRGGQVGERPASSFHPAVLARLRLRA